MDYLQQKRINVFDVIPAGFFNYLASNSNQRLYVECLELIYRQYEREISYCIPRNQNMILSSKRFLTEDYDRIMKVIKHKINVYLQVAIGRARFLRNREVDERGNIEQTIRYIVEEMEELDWREGLSEMQR